MTSTPNPFSYMWGVDPEEIAATAQGEVAATSDGFGSENPSLGAVTNAGGECVDRSAARAPVEAGPDNTSLAGGLESGIKDSFVDRTASGPDVKRAPIPDWEDISTAPLDGTPILARYMWQGKSRFLVIRRHQEYPWWQADHDSYVKQDDSKDTHRNYGFTHWMNIPAHPGLVETGVEA